MRAVAASSMILSSDSRATPSNIFNLCTPSAKLSSLNSKDVDAAFSLARASAVVLDSAVVETLAASASVVSRYSTRRGASRFVADDSAVNCDERPDRSESHRDSSCSSLLM